MSAIFVCTFLFALGKSKLATSHFVVQLFLHGVLSLFSNCEATTGGTCFFFGGNC